MRGVAGLRGLGQTSCTGFDDGCLGCDDGGNCVSYGPVSATPTSSTLPLDTTPTVVPAPTPAQSCVASGGSLVNNACVYFASAAPYSAPTGIPTSAPVGQAVPAAPSGYQWVQEANASAMSLAKVLAISQGGTVMQLPNGQQIITGSASGGVLGSSVLSGTLGTLGTQLTSMLPWLLLAGGAFLLFNMGRR